MLALPSTSKGVGGSSSSNISGSSVPQAAGAAPHSKTGAASRAARVLRERRQAEAGPFPSNLLCVLGCTLQLLDAFCMCFATASGRYLSAMEARQHACEQACHLCSHIFLALPAIPPPGLLTIACKLPASYMEKLCCLACEALPADNPAAWGVSCLIDDAGLQTVVDYAAALGKRSVCQRLDAVRYIPAMHVLARRVAPQALKLEGELRRCLDRTKAVHPETSLDRRLSNNFRRAWQWTWPRNGYPDNCPALALLPGSDKWALIDRDLVPRVGDDSLQRMVQYLDDKCRMPGSAGRLKGATTDAVYTSRLAAVLLSLQSSSIDEGRAKAAHHDAQLQDSLVGVARYATATSTQLLQGAASDGHKPPISPELQLLDRWFEQPGTVFMLEAVLRHMGSSEGLSSILKYITLQSIMCRSSMPTRLVGCMMADGAEGEARQGAAAIVTSLHVMLVKLLMLEIAERNSSGGGGVPHTGGDVAGHVHDELQRQHASNLGWPCENALRQLRTSTSWQQQQQ
ncbi:MAG: hypothetical protein WDW38_008248 [Sanguina aurantia]